MFRLLMLGLSQTDIAAAMFLSESTIKTHTRTILRKFGVPDRLHLVLWVLGEVRAGRPVPALDEGARK